jgi:hypothetical protein
VHGVQLECVTVGECAQERAERGRGTDPAEQGRHGTVAQHVQVVDAVRARGHAGHEARHLGVRRGTRTVLRPAQLHLLGRQTGEPPPLGQPHHWHQTGMRDQIRVIEPTPPQGHGKIASRGCSLALWMWNAPTPVAATATRCASRSCRPTSRAGGTHDLSRHAHATAAALCRLPTRGWLAEGGSTLPCPWWLHRPTCTVPPKAGPLGILDNDMPKPTIFEPGRAWARR